MSSSVGGPGSAQMQHLAALQAAAATRVASAVRAPAPAPVASAPAGEVSLWDVLTPDEKSFFAEAAQMGPLTYGPRNRAGAAAQSPSVPRGQRIDVRG